MLRKIVSGELEVSDFLQEVQIKFEYDNFLLINYFSKSILRF